MSWAATQRYDLTPAPEGLALLQDFMNTGPRPRPQTRDLLDTVGSAQTWSESAMLQWAERTGGLYRKTRLRKADVEELRHLRAGIASALRHRDGMEHQAPKTSTTLARVGISAVIDANAGVALELSRQGWENLASAMAIEAFRAQVADTWRRLKICRNVDCPAVFYDRSPNNSGVWHDVHTCGNVANLRASRARRSATLSTSP